MHFVACKTVRENNNSDRENIRKFYLEEKGQIQRDQQLMEEQSTQVQREPFNDEAGPSAPTTERVGPSSQ